MGGIRLATKSKEKEYELFSRRYVFSFSAPSRYFAIPSRVIYQFLSNFHVPDISKISPFFEKQGGNNVKEVRRKSGRVQHGRRCDNSTDAVHTTNGWYYGQAYQLYSSTRLSSSATGNAVTGNCAINAPRARIQITRKRDGKRDIIGELERAQGGRRWRWRRDEGNESRQPIEIKSCGGAMEGINSNSRAISVDQVSYSNFVANQSIGYRCTAIR